MIRSIKFLFSVLIVSFTFISCDKEYSLENGGLGNNGGGGSSSGTSVYTWEGAPGTCVTPVISGVYQAATALNGSNTVVLTVNVTTVGTYTVSTGTNNGISFSGTGTFTITGSQIIVLTGSGTPAAAGTFNFTPGTNGCSFQITSTPVVIGPVAVGTLDCTAASLAGIYTQSISLTGTNTVTIPVNVTTAGSYTINTTATNGCTFSGSGTLALGAQTIILTGSGIPANAGPVSFPVSMGTSNCNFSITFLPAPPPAAGTLDCAGITVAGVYTQGSNLIASNTITIPVNVTTAGLYSISSTANGVSFSGSGILATGSQVIVLTGSGIPTNAGAFSFPVNLGTSSCSFSITFLPGLPPTDYFRVKIDGVLTTFHVNLLGDDTPLFGGFTNTIEGDVAIGSDEHLDITVNKAFSAITVGTYLHPFGLVFSTSRYVDANGDGWQPADNSSPAYSVVVTAVTPTRITGRFSGQYKSQNGTGTGSKIFTNGEFSVPIQ